MLARKKRLAQPGWWRKLLALLNEIAFLARRRHPLTRFRKVKCIYGINI
ncbi:hypothetical protein HUU05_26595 [candidate division KSB1 bacterium]|nr:hypothetical protein [candidate division KSB1 bacterium]